MSRITTSNPARSLLLSRMSNDELVLLRASLDAEMRRRNIAFSVGGVGEGLAIEHYRKTPGLPKLQLASAGTKNVDANSRNGERYSIKTVCNAKKTGTIYPDAHDRDKQLFEYLLIVKLSEDWALQAIYELSWADFVRVRSWDIRMNAWYVGCSASTLRQARRVFSKTAY
jgi:hypothetical protein